jgi:hypothetical protein
MYKLFPELRHFVFLLIVKGGSYNLAHGPASLFGLSLEEVSVVIDLPMLPD